MTLQSPPAPSAQLLDFTPVPLRHRADGWTAERQRQFIAALAAMGSVRGACRVVGMSHRHAYDLRFHPEAGEFCAAWDMALANGLALMEDAACDRAINGESTPIMYKDAQVGERVRYDNRLLMFLLRARNPEVYGRGLQSQKPPQPGSELYEQWEAEWLKRKEEERAQVEKNTSDLMDKYKEMRDRMISKFESGGMIDKVVPLDPRSASIVETAIYEQIAKARGVFDKLDNLGLGNNELEVMREKIERYEAQNGEEQAEQKEPEDRDFPEYQAGPSAGLSAVIDAIEDDIIPYTIDS